MNHYYHQGITITLIIYIYTLTYIHISVVANSFLIELKNQIMASTGNLVKLPRAIEVMDLGEELPSNILLNQHHL